MRFFLACLLCSALVLAPVVSPRSASAEGPAATDGSVDADSLLVAFSKMRPVFYQANFTSMKFLAPPYGKFATKVFDFLVKFKG